MVAPISQTNNMIKVWVKAVITVEIRPHFLMTPLTTPAISFKYFNRIKLFIPCPQPLCSALMPRPTCCCFTSRCLRIFLYLFFMILIIFFSTCYYFLPILLTIFFIVSCFFFLVLSMIFLFKCRYFFLLSFRYSFWYAFLQDLHARHTPSL